MCNNGPKPLKIAQKAIILHTSGVQVGLTLGGGSSDFAAGQSSAYKLAMV